MSINYTLQDVIDQVIVDLKAIAFEGYGISMSSTSTLQALLVNFERLRLDFHCPRAVSQRSLSRSKP